MAKDGPRGLESPPHLFAKFLEGFTAAQVEREEVIPESGRRF